MAKITGLGGMLRGKSGPNVFRVSRGVQIMQQYNPNPNNPRSPKQEDRRLMFGDAVRQAKAFYDNPVTGQVWKRAQYKPRNLAVSAALKNPNVSPVEGTELTRLAAANLNQNWTGGFDFFGRITGEYDGEKLKFRMLLKPVETNQPITGLIIILYARPGYKNSSDDNMVYNLPDKPLVQAKAVLWTNEIKPGSSHVINSLGDEFKFLYASSAITAPEFEMPEIEKYEELGEIAVNRAWFAIPLTQENTGKGLRMEINNRMFTLGNMQYIWKASNTTNQGASIVDGDSTSQVDDIVNDDDNNQVDDIVDNDSRNKIKQNK